jgi:hypothetical protein
MKFFGTLVAMLFLASVALADEPTQQQQDAKNQAEMDVYDVGPAASVSYTANVGSSTSKNAALAFKAIAVANNGDAGYITNGNMKVSDGDVKHGQANQKNNLGFSARLEAESAKGSGDTEWGLGNWATATLYYQLASAKAVLAMEYYNQSTDIYFAAQDDYTMAGQYYYDSWNLPPEM